MDYGSKLLITALANGAHIDRVIGAKMDSLGHMYQVRVCMCVYVCMCVWVYVYVCVYVYGCMGVRVYVHIDRVIGAKMDRL